MAYTGWDSYDGVHYTNGVRGWADILLEGTHDGWDGAPTSMYANALNDWNDSLGRGVGSEQGFLDYASQRGASFEYYAGNKGRQLVGGTGNGWSSLVPVMYNYLTEEQQKETARIEAERKRKEEEARKKLEALQKQQEETTQRNKLSANQIKASSSVAAPKQERKNSTPILGGGGFNFGGMQLGFNDLLGKDEGF